MRLPPGFSNSRRFVPEAEWEPSISLLLRRDDDGVGETRALIIAVVFVAVVIILFLGYLVLRYCRKRRQEPPKFLPENLKKRWRRWHPGTYTSPGPTARLPSTRSRNSRTRAQQQQQRQAGVDRHASVRSVMTLPEYRPIAAADRERTIGREGERGGIDVVIEYPETMEEEEERREEHMQTLYEIRLARQLERAAQRESGEISANADSGSSIRLVAPDPPSSAAQLMAALASITEREPRVSKIQYAEIGVARHDGTRVRPSIDSDRRALLEGPAPMGNGGGGGSAASIRSVYMHHSRTESGTSYISGTGTPERRGSDEIMRMGSARPSMETRGAEGRPSFTVRRESQDGLLPPPPSFPHITEPPVAYDGADWGPPPDYTSPIETRNHGIEGLPVLRVDTGTPTPGGSRAPSPTMQPQQLTPTVRKVSNDSVGSS